MKLESPLIQDECCDHGGEGPTVYDLPVPLSLREEWKRLATRRHFLGRMGKTLGWAGLTRLLGNSFVGPAAGAGLIFPGAHCRRASPPQAKPARSLLPSAAAP